MLQFSLKIMFAVTVFTILVTSTLVQIAPASATTAPLPPLTKRNYDYLSDQHTTARLGNTRVCGDHMCMPGEWTKYIQGINTAQISHEKEKVPTSTIIVKNVHPAPATNSTSMNMTKPVTNSTVNTPIVPPPIPSPLQVPAVCGPIKTLLANSTIPASVISKVIADLGC